MKSTLRKTHLLFLLIISLALHARTFSLTSPFTYIQSDSTHSEAHPSSGLDTYPPVAPDPWQPLEPSVTGNYPDGDYLEYPTPPDVSSTDSYPVAATPVSADVSPMGASTFSIPIETPPGAGGMSPRLSISYSSMTGNGLAGLGCGIQGLSAITRSVRDIWHDGNAGRLSYNGYDALRLDGRRLIPKGSGIMSDGNVYVLEDDPFTEITLHGTGTGIWFDVKTSDGRTLRYGDTDNSRQTISPSSGSPFVNAWHISRVEDSRGNYMTYSYLHDNYTLYPQTISYGKNKHAQRGADNSVNFIYGDRSDKIPYIIKDVSGSMSKLLRSIETKTGDALYRHIELSYSADQGSGMNRLRRVQVWRETGSRQRSIEIAWNDSPGFLPSSVKLDVGGMSIPMTKKTNQRFLTGDINGDGVSDIVEFTNAAITLGVSTTGYSNYCIPYFSSVNADGTVSYQRKPYIDIGPDVQIDRWTVNNGLPFLSDINGDGRQDLVIPTYSSVSGQRRINLDVYWGNSDGLSRETASSVSAELVNAKSMPLYASADFDNDGRGEVVVIEPTQGNTGANVCQLITYAKDGEYITPRYFNIVLNVAPQRIFTADFNGDGLTDFMIVHSDGCYTYINKGDGISDTEYYTGYDATGRFVEKKDNDTDPTSKSYTYDTFGNMLTETDDTVEDSPLTTRHSYDSWGRETNTTTPSGAEIKTLYGWGPNQSMRYYKLSYSLGQPWQKTWYDSCGRIVKTESVGEGGLLSTTETKYNSKGQETETVHTAGKLTLSTSKEYDSRGRITKEASSAGKTVSYTYGNRKISVTDSGRTTVREYDAQGNVRKITDPLTTLEYRYFSNGNPSCVTCGGSTVRMEYDEAGNRTKLDDPDAGVTTTVYDAEGKIQSQTDGRGVKKSYRYDRLGRLVYRTGALQDVSYSYDKRGNVTSEEHGNNRITHVYDKYSRQTAEYRDFDGGETQLHRWKYNKFGDIIQETYANGSSVDYVYDAYGNNTALIVNNDTVWQETSKDGLVTTESLFGGKYTCQKSHDDNGYLTGLLLKNTADGKTLRQLKYKYDGATGNMTSRRDEQDGVEEIFTYDSLDRLLSCHKNFFICANDGVLRPYDNQLNGAFPGDAVVNPGAGEIGKIDFLNTDKYTYSADGNILTFPTSGKYTYSQEHPHAVERISGPVKKFPSTSQNIYYNDIGKTDAVSEKKEDGEYYLDFYYGPDDERWTTYLTIYNKTVKTILFGSGYEKIDDSGTLREFTYIGNGLLYYSENGGEAELLYMFTDAQGSVSDIYDREGNIVFSAGYDPWGNMTVSKNDIGFVRGYTGHEMLPEFGLINMNGRMYDPQLGRFLSPDNYVQMPDNSQSFNRFSYCLNNPLKYTDPSGEMFGIDDLLFITAVGAVSGMMNAKANGESLWKGALFGGLSSAASYSVGALFGHSLGTMGNEILRAGSHGLVNGLMGTIDGHGFSTGFASGFMSSLAGSGMQALGIESSNILLGGCSVAGGLTSRVMGDDFSYGANIGLNIGLYNHGWKYDENGNRLYYELDEVVVYGQRKNFWLNEGRGYNNFIGNILYGFDDKLYKPRIIGTAFNYSLKNNKFGLSSVETMSKYIKPNMLKYANRASNASSIVYGAVDTYQGYVKDGNTLGYNATKAASKSLISFAAGLESAKVCAEYGTLYGGIYGGIISGIVGGIAGSLVGGYISDCSIDYLFY